MDFGDDFGEDFEDDFLKSEEIEDIEEIPAEEDGELDDTPEEMEETVDEIEKPDDEMETEMPEETITGDIEE